MRWNKYALSLLITALGIGQIYIIYEVFFANTYPIIEAQSTLIDFGTLPKGAQLTRNVNIYNRGQSQLKITNIQMSCGCSEVSLENNNINPGESSTLQISLKGDGALSKSVRFYLVSNDPQHPVYQLKAISNSITESFVEPKEIDFGRIDHDTQLPCSQSFKLILKDLIDPSDVSVECKKPYLKISDVSSSNNDFKEYRITLLKESPTGDILSKVLFSDRKNSLKIEMGVHGYVKGRFFALPQMLTAGPIDPNSEDISENISINIRQSDNGTRETKKNIIKLESIDISDSLKDLLSIKTIQDNDNLNLCANISPKSYRGVWSIQRIEGHVEIKCSDNEGHPEILNIPVLIYLHVSKIRDG